MDSPVAANAEGAYECAYNCAYASAASVSISDAAPLLAVRISIAVSGNNLAK